jgi:hypothetical protein
MHLRLSQVLDKSMIVPSVLIVALGVRPAWADDSGILGRLFRLGGGSSSSGTDTARPNQSSPLPSGRIPGSTANSGQPEPTSPLGSSSTSAFGGLPQTPVTTPAARSTGPGQRISPKPRVSPAITTADPVLTRLAVGRSNDGSQFGMFLQIFADGTVLDSEGAHRLRASELKPIVDLVSSGDLYKVRGHCGAPSTDFIEYVHVVVYERRLGRLTAHSFSYSGNTQGCDHAIRHLHTTLENLQVKLSRQPILNHSGDGGLSTPAPLGPAPASTTNPGSGNAAPELTPPSNRQPGLPAVNPGTAAPTGPVIPLTPVDPSR